MFKVTERIPNFVDVGREPNVTLVQSPKEDIPQIEWIKERMGGHESLIIENGAVFLPSKFCIALYEYCDCQL